MNKKKKYHHNRSIIKSLGVVFFNILYRHQKVQPNKILFLNFSGKYDCNPKYICEEFLREKDKFELVFATGRHDDFYNTFPREVKVVRRGTKDFYKGLYSAKVIIENDIVSGMVGFKKKKNQILMETWHGSIGIKKFGRDANDDTHWHKMADKSAKMTDILISCSKFETNLYKETFWKDNQIFEFGHPRNDIFYKGSKHLSEIKEKICKIYNINPQNKLCLYAPTFRDEPGLEVYQMNFKKLEEGLSKKFGGNWTTLVRYHDITSKESGEEKQPGGAINVTSYPDIQELAAIIDVGITDYSSWICEYVLRKRPGFIYATDADDYKDHERKLTIPLEELPFPLAKNMDELLQNISLFDRMIYEDKCTDFLKRHGSVDDGNASKRVVNKVKELLKL